MGFNKFFTSQWSVFFFHFIFFHLFHYIRTAYAVVVILMDYLKCNIRISSWELLFFSNDKANNFIWSSTRLSMKFNIARVLSCTVLTFRISLESEKCFILFKLKASNLAGLVFKFQQLHVRLRKKELGESYNQEKSFFFQDCYLLLINSSFQLL